MGFFPNFGTFFGKIWQSARIRAESRISGRGDISALYCITMQYIRTEVEGTEDGALDEGEILNVGDAP